MAAERFSTQRLRAYLDQDHYRLHPEVWKRLRELQIDLNDALYVLQHGVISADPDLDPKIGKWRFSVQGQTVDQNELRIDFTFVEVDGVLVLTVMNEGLSQA
jgi:hypothetical protein